MAFYRLQMVRLNGVESGGARAEFPAQSRCWRIFPPFIHPGANFRHDSYMHQVQEASSQGEFFFVGYFSESNLV